MTCLPVGDDTTAWKKQPAALRFFIDFPGFMVCTCINDVIAIMRGQNTCDSLELSKESWFFFSTDMMFLVADLKSFMYIHIF